MSHVIHTLTLSSENRPVPMALFVKGTNFPWAQVYHEVEDHRFDPSKYHALWMLNWCKYTLTHPEIHYPQLPAAASIWSAILIPTPTP